MTTQTAQVAVEAPADLRARVAQLQQALDTRIVIEQAKGVLAERYCLRMDDAFALLRRAARGNRIKIHDLAAQVVASRATPAPILHTLVRSQKPVQPD
jgi:AmiR/NasT family two-component response regulator